MNVRLGLICAMLLAATVGCTNIKQSNRLTFVTALGIDKENDGVRVYALVAVPNRAVSLNRGGGGASERSAPNYILTEAGQDVAEALYTMKRKSARDIIFDHTQIFLFSEEIARGGLAPHLDLFLRREEFQLTGWIAVTKGSTKDVLQVKPNVPDSVSDYLVDTFSGAGSDSMEILPINLSRFLSYSLEPGRTPYAPIVRTQPEGNYIALDNLALFRGSRMIRTIAPYETKYIQLMQGGRKKTTSFTIGKRTYNLLRSRSKVGTDGQQLKSSLFVELELNQIGQQGAAAGENRSVLEETASDYIQEQMEKLIRKLQEMHVDPIGFGDKYRLLRHGELDMEHWLMHMYPNMPVHVEVKVDLERTGMLSNEG